MCSSPKITIPAPPKLQPMPTAEDVKKPKTLFSEVASMMHNYRMGGMQKAEGGGYEPKNAQGLNKFKLSNYGGSS